MAALAAAIVALTLVTYAPVRNHEFVDLDDWAGILWNRDVQVDSVSSALRISFTHLQISSWVPLTTLSHQLDRKLYGQDPTGVLVTNVVLHTLTSLLLFWALTAMTGARVASAAVAAIFAVHPLHVESVAWASERKDTLSGIFFALMLLGYAYYVKRPESLGRYLLVLSCLLLGLLAKPMLVTAPFVLLLLDFWPLRRFDAAAIREKVPMFVLVALFSAMTIYVQQVSGALEFGERLGVADRLVNAVDSVAAYVQDSFWPSGLAAFYPHSAGGVPVWRLTLGALLVVGVSAVAFGLRRSEPYLLTGWFWFVGMLVPVIGLLQVGMQGRADRYTYLPMIGLAMAVVFATREIARRTRREHVAAALGALLIVALAVAAARQVKTWRDSVTLYERVLAVSPDAAFAHQRLGMVYAMRGRFSLAEPYFERAYALDPALGRDVVRQLDAMAVGHAVMERFPMAAEAQEQAIAVAAATGQGDQVPELRGRLRLLRAGKIPAPRQN